MFNKVILVGNLTRDIELRYSSSGVAIAKVGIATNRRFKSATGEMKDETMFIDLTFFGRTAEIANQYLRKGSKVLVEGRLILEQWVGADGTKRSRHSVTVENMQMLDSKSDSMQQQSSYDMSAANSYSQPQQPTAAPQTPPSQPSSLQQSEPKIPEIDIDEDDIPF
ncbi:MAG: single-stranded DNA-binding protein [Epsilonproteobacteria bacterium]|nr:single-stranded DNA-binding protein [Campylobacterota bacterium]